MPEVIITENTVPGTDVVITVARKTSLVDGRVYFLTTRKPGTSDFVNYLQCGRNTETEAHEQADFLWNDTVERRDADSTSPYRPRCHWCDARCALISHPDGHGKSDDCRCARHAVPSHRRNKVCLGCDATLALSDPDICEKCEEHGIIIVNGRAYAPVRRETYKIGQYVGADCRRCNDRTGQYVQSSTAAGLVLKCGRCGQRSLRSPLVNL